MTKQEFAKVIRFLELAIGKPIHEDSTLAIERTRIYFKLLGDLSIESLWQAAERLTIERKWPTFPQAAEIRELAVMNSKKEVCELSSSEAWELAWKAAGRIDPEVDGSAQRACKDLPALVRRSMEAYGIISLCYGKDPVTVVRAQFMKVFEQVANRERRAALLPKTLKDSIEGTKATLPSKITEQLAGIGRDAT